jgi:hypothetical protein
MYHRLARALATMLLAAGWLPATTSPAPNGVAVVPSGGCSRPFDDARVRCLFHVTGDPERWVVPDGVGFLAIDAWGAQGAPVEPSWGSGVPGGTGGGVSVGVDVRGGETLAVDVGPSHHGRRGGRGGSTTVSDAMGAWIVAGGGAAAGSGSAGGGWSGGSGTAGTSGIRRDRPALDAQVDPLGKHGDGLVRLVYVQPDPDGSPAVVVARRGGGGREGRGVAYFTAVFSEPVSGVTGSDVHLAGPGARSLDARVDEVAPFDGTRYDITVSGRTAEAVTASLPAGAAVDDDFSTNTASTAMASGSCRRVCPW